MLLYVFVSFAGAQDIPPVTEQKLENLADADQAETEDDSYLIELEQFRKNPVNLNTADENELKELRILTDLQISNLLSYRKLLGNFVSIYELQSVPTWDVATIKKLLPFITVSTPVSVTQSITSRLRGGDNSFLIRYSQIMEKSVGYDKSTSGTKYLGSLRNYLSDTGILIEIYFNTAWLPIKMQESNFFAEHKSKDLIFILFIFLPGKSGSFNHLL